MKVYRAMLTMTSATDSGMSFRVAVGEAKLVGRPASLLSLSF